MEVVIRLDADSHNTYDVGSIKIRVRDGKAFITVDDNRILTVSKDELIYALNQPQE